MTGLQIIEYAWRNYGHWIISALLAGAALIVTAKHVRRTADQWWREHLIEFAPDKARLALERRDAKIVELKEQLRELQADRRSLVDAIRAGMAFADRTRAILSQPEIVRIKDRERRA